MEFEITTQESAAEMEQRSVSEHYERLENLREPIHSFDEVIGEEKPAIDFSINKLVS